MKFVTCLLVTLGRPIDYGVVGMINFWGGARKPRRQLPLALVRLCMLVILEIWIDLSWSNRRATAHGPPLWVYFHVIWAHHTNTKTR